MNLQIVHKKLTIISLFLHNVSFLFYAYIKFKQNY